RFALIVAGLTAGHAIDDLGVGAEENIAHRPLGTGDDAVAVEDGGPAFNDIAGVGLIGPGLRHVVGRNDVAVVESGISDETLADAVEIGETFGGAGAFAGAADGGEEDGDEDGEDGDDNEEFDEGEGAGAGRVFHGGTLVTWFRSSSR